MTRGTTLVFTSKCEHLNRLRHNVTNRMLITENDSGFPNSPLGRFRSQLRKDFQRSWLPDFHLSRGRYQPVDRLLVSIIAFKVPHLFHYHYAI